ncbi:MAG TPA: hypothetical protein VE714_05545, partial [Gemmatimonadales bacterium]|nr:hypothetical protein [Gemmatimonadales bacterium]
MSEYGRRAASIAAIFLVVLACVFALMYWWGRGQVNNTARALLKTDLQKLSVAESLYFVMHHRYTHVLSELPNYLPRSAVSVDLADSNSWEASAVDP